MPALAARPLDFRPNLIPTWDLRQACLKVLLEAEEPADAFEIVVALTNGRPNEDDVYSVRAVFIWANQKRLTVKHRPLYRGAPPRYTLSPRGAELALGPITPFL